MNDAASLTTRNYQPGDEARWLALLQAAPDFPYDGQVVGECWSWIDDPTIAQTGEKQGDVWCLCVHPRHRQRSLGRALLLAGVQWLRQQGMTSAHLWVDGANDRARHLYEAVGFVAARTDIWYREELCTT